MCVCYHSDMNGAEVRELRSLLKNIVENGSFSNEGWVYIDEIYYILNKKYEILKGRILCNSCSYQDGGWHCITELEELGYDACECDE